MLLRSTSSFRTAPRSLTARLRRYALFTTLVSPPFDPSLFLQVWAKEAPEDINSGRVKLTVHDFFNPQPVKGADIYFFRVVMYAAPSSLFPRRQ